MSYFKKNIKSISVKGLDVAKIVEMEYECLSLGQLKNAIY